MKNDPQNSQTTTTIVSPHLDQNTLPDQPTTSSQQKTDITHKKENIFKDNISFKLIIAITIAIAFLTLLLILTFDPNISNQLLPSSLSNLPEILLGAITISGIILSGFLDPESSKNEKAKKKEKHGDHNPFNELANQAQQNQNSQTLSSPEQSKRNEAPDNKNSPAVKTTSWTKLVTKFVKKEKFSNNR